MNNLLNKTIAFIGAGNMAEAIIAGLINSGVDATNIIACNRSEEKQQRLHNQYQIQVNYSNQQAIEHADVVVLGVKPQMMDELLAELTTTVSFDDKLIITMAAGLNSDKYFKHIPKSRLIRVMPNTPSFVGYGMTGLFNASDNAHFGNETITTDNQVADELFTAVGKNIWLNTESQIDDVAAISGSGPAYFLLFMEALTDKAIKLGFDKQQSKELVLQTCLGAGHLALEQQQEFQQLRRNITSPGGTTAEAINVMEQHQLSSMIDTALDAAILRAQQLNNN